MRRIDSTVLFKYMNIYIHENNHYYRRRSVSRSHCPPTPRRHAFTDLPESACANVALWFDRDVNLSEPLTIGKREPPRFSSQLAGDLFLGGRKNASMWDYQSERISPRVLSSIISGPLYPIAANTHYIRLTSNEERKNSSTFTCYSCQLSSEGKKWKWSLDS